MVGKESIFLFIIASVNAQHWKLRRLGEIEMQIIMGEAVNSTQMCEFKIGKAHRQLL